MTRRTTLSFSPVFGRHRRRGSERISTKGRPGTGATGGGSGGDCPKGAEGSRKRLPGTGRRGKQSTHRSGSGETATVGVDGTIEKLHARKGRGSVEFENGGRPVGGGKMIPGRWYRYLGHSTTNTL